MGRICDACSSLEIPLTSESGSNVYFLIAGQERQELLGIALLDGFCLRETRNVLKRFSIRPHLCHKRKLNPFRTLTIGSGCWYMVYFGCSAMECKKQHFVASFTSDDRAVGRFRCRWVSFMNNSIFYQLGFFQATMQSYRVWVMLQNEFISKHWRFFVLVIYYRISLRHRAGLIVMMSPVDKVQFKQSQPLSHLSLWTATLSISLLSFILVCWIYSQCAFDKSKCVD